MSVDSTSKGRVSLSQTLPLFILEIILSPLLPFQVFHSTVRSKRRGRFMQSTKGQGSPVAKILLLFPFERRSDS